MWLMVLFSIIYNPRYQALIDVCLKQAKNLTHQEAQLKAFVGPEYNNLMVLSE